MREPDEHPAPRALDPAAVEVERLRRRLGRALLGGAAGVLAVVAWLGISAGQPDTSRLGRPAPPLELAALEGSGRVTLVDLAGRVAVINVWASWCAPCREEAPALRAAHERPDPARVAFLGVVHDDRPEPAREFVRDFAIAYRNAIDDGSFGRDWGVRGLPMTFIVDAGGTLMSTHFGPVSESRLTALIEEALARSASGGGG